MMMLKRAKKRLKMSFLMRSKRINLPLEAENAKRKPLRASFGSKQ